MYTREEQSSIIHPGNNIVRIHIILKNTGCDFTCMSTGQTWTTSQMYSHKGDIIVNKKWKSKNWERSKLQLFSQSSVFSVRVFGWGNVWANALFPIPRVKVVYKNGAWGYNLALASKCIHPHRKNHSQLDIVWCKLVYRCTSHPWGQAVSFLNLPESLYLRAYSTITFHPVTIRR